MASDWKVCPDRLGGGRKGLFGFYLEDKALLDKPYAYMKLQVVSRALIVLLWLSTFIVAAISDF